MYVESSNGSAPYMNPQQGGNPSKGAEVYAGDTCYIDMGILYGGESFMTWWPNVGIDQTKFDAYLDSLFASFKKNGVNMMDLSFAQLCDIEQLAQGKGEGASGNDKISSIFADGYEVIRSDGTSTGQNFLQYMTARAHADGIKVDVSFGGANASSTDWDPGKGTAGDLANFMNEYNIDSVDFDMETSLPQGVDYNQFFSELHSLLQSSNKQMILTVEGDLSNAKKLDLNNFDGVNLMLYSTSQYYIDADNDTWGLKQWIAAVGNPQKIHVGFYDSIPYENPSASAGEPYPIPEGLSRGDAAAFVYESALNELGLTPDQVGEPFWWSDNPMTLAQDQVMQDFWSYLNGENR
ncbi:MAG: glycoside hydrolase family 18 protein [Chlamydiales bacterium]